MKKIRKKITLLDIIVLLLFAGVIIYLAYRVTGGLNYKWNWSAVPQYLFRYDPAGKSWVPNILMQGLFATIRLSIWATVLATIIGIIMGLFRISKSRFNRTFGRIYVELIRNTPPLVLIFIFYFFISGQVMSNLGIDAFIQSRSDTAKSVIEFLFAPAPRFTQFLSALITLALFEGAYITEIVRAGILSVDKGQWEASYALGLSRFQQMRYIILPLTAQRIMPPLAGQFISTIKDSAIVSVISIQELTFQGMELMSATYLTFEIWITITCMYLVITLSLSVAIRRLEIYLRRSEA